MYGKIARLSTKNGYCWAGNSFLDKTKSGRNASRAIAELRINGYIVIENDRSRFRKIRLCEIKSRVNLANFGEVQKNSTSPNLAEYDGDLANSGEVQPEKTAYIAKFGDRISSSSYINTTTTAPQPPPETPEAAVPFSQTELKQALSAIDPGLILTADFYPRAAAFMAANGLGLKYLSWMYQQCVIKKPYSLIGMYFTLFFEDSQLEIYKAIGRPASPPRPPPPLICPVCGAEHAPSDEKCPSCALPQNALPETVVLYKQLHVFTPEKKDEYLEREKALYTECGFDFDKLNSRIAALHQEFGIPS